MFYFNEIMWGISKKERLVIYLFSVLLSIGLLYLLFSVLEKSELKFEVKEVALPLFLFVTAANGLFLGISRAKYIFSECRSSMIPVIVSGFVVVFLFTGMLIGSFANLYLLIIQN